MTDLLPEKYTAAIEAALDRASYRQWQGTDRRAALGTPVKAELRGQSDEERGAEERAASWANVEAIMAALPEPERDVLTTHLAGHSERSGADILGISHSTYGYRLKRALAHCAPLAARFYAGSADPVPEAYQEALENVELPTTADEVVAVYNELGSVKRTAAYFGIDHRKVSRIIREAA